MKWPYARVLWCWLTETAALKETSGRYETEFFESMYRVIYLAGYSQSDHGVLYKLYSCLMKIQLALYLSGGFWYLCTMSAGPDETITNINTLCINLIAIYRYQIWVKNKYIYKKLAMSMESPYLDVATTTREDIVQFWVKKSDRYLQILFEVVCCVIIFGCVTPLFDDIDYNFVLNCRVPYNYKTPLRYAFTYIVFHIGFWCCAFFVTVNDIIMQSHLMHLLCQFQILADCFENIIEDCNVDFVELSDQALLSNDLFKRKYTDQLRKCVKQHQFLLNQAQDFRELLSTPMLIQLASSGLNIILIGYQLTMNVSEGMAKLLIWVIYLVYNLFVIFVICRWCDEIKTKSEAIREAVYMSGWERGLAVTMPKVRLQLLLVAARAAQPVVLTAGGIYDLSLSSFASLLKGSYSVLTVMYDTISR